MKKFKPGDVVKVDFPGVTGIKRRPVVIVSTDTYHKHRPDIVVGVITSQTNHAITPFDHLLHDWSKAGLNRPSAFRSFLATLPAGSAEYVGHCTSRDWEAIQACLGRAIAFQQQ